MVTNAALTVCGDMAGLRRYITMANSYPMLTPEEESTLIKEWVEHRDKKAAHQLVVSHIRLVIKIAMRYRNYGLAMVDMVSEGVAGLVNAVRKFDSSKGARLATYATWWIKAHIQSFIINSWSLVKVGTTSAQRKLFFNLRNMRNKIVRYHESDFLCDDKIRLIADRFAVSANEVRDMDARMTHQDASLNDCIGDGSYELQDTIPICAPSQEDICIASEIGLLRSSLLKRALASLSERERAIVVSRQMVDKPKTLDALGKVYSISTERVRQIQDNAMKKLRKFVLDKAVSVGL